MAGSSGENQLKVFDCKNNYVPCASINDVREGIYACDYGNVSNKFSFAGGEGVVYIMGITETADWNH